MLNYIWGFMIIGGILWGIFTGNTEKVTQGLLDSAKDAVELCITMLGIMSFWSGIMKVGEKSGVIKGLSRLLSPAVNYLFPGLKPEHPARKFIITNITANILGLGWAATPAGLKAMKELAGDDELKKIQRKAASNEMCTFLIINISSLQLIPVNVIAYRNQYGSVNPAGIIAPAIAATLCSTLAAVLFCKVMQRHTKMQYPAVR